MGRRRPFALPRSPPCSLSPPAWAAALALAVSVLTRSAGAQRAPAPPVVGRWDLRVTAADGTVLPSWLEVQRSGARTLVGRFVGSVGSARPIGHVAVAGDTMRFAIPPQWDEGAGELRVEAVLAGDRLAGTLVAPDGARYAVAGTRAPTLLRTTEPVWGAPIALFNGRDLTGWAPRGGANRWRAVGGVLANTGAGANLATTRAFGDFRLHVEVRVPPGGNSGIYLRGRHEVQVEDDEVPAAARAATEPASTHIGGVYGFLAPSTYAGRGAGQWQTYDITLVGRRVTVVLNGRTVIAGQPIPGITGGALDSDEGTPGPLLLQGDHGPVEYRNVVLTPAR
jgi:hypothetical protein